MVCVHTQLELFPAGVFMYECKVESLPVLLASRVAVWLHR